jgi:magnesium chelatase accessory protein
MPAPDRPDWSTDGRNWPNRADSRFVDAGGLRWHVQVAGAGPDLLLLHGTGAATHSWAGLLPLLARTHRVIAPDLPGHGFTVALPQAEMSPTGMGRAVAALLRVLDAHPVAGIGHSAGAALLIRMTLDRLIDPLVLFGINGAILPLGAVPLHVFGPLARWLSSSSLVPRLFAFHASDRTVAERLLRGTGSSPPPETLRCYAALFRRSGHAAGALAMMAHWDLPSIARDLPGLTAKLVLIVGDNDRTIPPEEANSVRRKLPGAEIVHLSGLGHLAHEEEPGAVAAIIGARLPA